MTSLQAYLSNSRTKKVLSRKPGEEGFSLIELVVVVAVLAILSAIAIPSFTSINNKARSAAAANTVATVAKECAVKFANGEGTPARPVVTPDGYNAISVTNNAGNSATTGCTQTGEITAAPNTAQASILPTFTYNVSTGAKTCTASRPGCSASGTW
tara:strand:- start:5347 stop:5814 length:468 start_codon:yes stop_codon:yes gene_type:complete